MTATWEPPADWLRVTTIDAHTGGEPLRLITSGLPEPPGVTMLEKRRNAKAAWDPLRRALMWEPRGHADMYGALLTAPVTPDADTGVLFLHNEGFSTMCGHGIIAVVTVGVETGRLRPNDPGGAIRIDTPAGRVVARAHLLEGRVERVSFLNVSSFVLAPDLVVEVPGLGPIRCDIAFGGAFYAYLDAAAVGVKLGPGRYAAIIDVGMRIKRAVAESYRIVHPAGASDLDFLYGVILSEPAGNGSDLHSRNVCVFAEGEVDRSPTGTGVSGRAAILHARGELAVGETITIESLVGSRFDVRVAETTSVGTAIGVIPEVTGSAWITGRHEFLLDPRDPFREGFLLR